jgi:glycerophosphoryl diester phosphodiesterase
MTELKQFDIGYGYTADDGKTFPFRGKAVGMMPTLNEVLTTFPENRILINVKSRDRSEGEKLASVLNRLTSARRSQIMVYGGDEPIEVIRRLAPDVRTIARATIELPRRIYRVWLDGHDAASLQKRNSAGANQCRPLAVGLARSILEPDDGRQQPCVCARSVQRRRVLDGDRYPRTVPAVALKLSGGSLTNEIEAIARLVRERK